MSAKKKEVRLSQTELRYLSGLVYNDKAKRVLSGKGAARADKLLIKIWQAMNIRG